MKKIFIALMLCAASISTWAFKSNDHVSVKYVEDNSGKIVYTQLTINECDPGWERDQHGRWYRLECNHSLKEIIDAAEITEADKIDLITVNLDNKAHKVVEGFPYLKAYTINLRKVTNLDSWRVLKNQYVSNVLLQYKSGFGQLDNSIIENFNPERLYNVIVLTDACQPCQRTEIDAYVNKPGFLAYGLQYISEVAEQAGYGQYSNVQTWWNNGTPNGGNGYTYWTRAFTKIRLSGYVFARDIMSGVNDCLTPEGHLRPFPQKITYQDRGPEYRPGSRCDNPLAPSNSDPNVIFYDEPANYGNGYGAMTGSRVHKFDLTNAQFGQWVEENGKQVFKYYPADMTLSMLQEIDKDGCVEELYLPTSPTQYIIPEGFLHDSKNIHELCIPSNYTEIGRYAFLGAQGEGFTHFTTTATEVDEQKQLFNGIKKGDLIDYGNHTLTLPSTTKFVGRGAFSGYDGAALLEDVYVLAEEAPICEMFAFDQKTYVGDNFHHQGHLIKKGNYVNANMAMLHFPNTTSRIEMLNYSDMTRKYRLYDETGHYDNLGNILVWPTQAQYNRSFNQALAGVTWWSWKENLDGVDDPENAYSAGQVAGRAYANANHEYVFSKAAADDGFSDQFTLSFDGENPNSSFNPNEGKGQGFNSNQNHWDEKLLAKSVPASEKDRPLSYDWVKYGGWHQFVITELYDFLLDDPDPDGPEKFYFNYAKYNKNIWYAVCFAHNLTKAQVLKAFGNEKTGEYPVLATLSSVRRDANSANITVVMSKNLLNNKLVYGEGEYANTVKYKNFKPDYVPVNYGDDDIVMEANKPYFILPCLPEEELVKAATGYRRLEYTPLKEDKIQFPIPTHVHAVKETYDAYVNEKDEAVNDTTVAFNYYFVGNYIPETSMPENVYYLKEYQKKNGDYWSSFHRNSPEEDGLKWAVNEAIIVAVVDDKSGARSKECYITRQQVKHGGVDHNYIWGIKAYDDWVFCAGTDHQTYAKSAFGMQLGDNFTTTIQLPDDFVISEDNKVYNLNGQFVGVDSDNMPKGVYVVGGKKVVVK